MAADAAGERELFEEFAEAGSVLALLCIDFRIRTFQINGRKHTGSTMAWSGEKNHVQIVLLDVAHQVDVAERQTGTRTPVSQQAILDVLRLEGFAQERI